MGGVNGAEKGAQGVPRDLHEWMRAYPGRERALSEALADADFWEEWAKGNAARLNKVTEERDEYKRLHGHASDLYEMFRRLYDDEHDRAERLRLAWLSARRRAAKESEYAAEVVARISVN